MISHLQKSCKTALTSSCAPHARPHMDVLQPHVRVTAEHPALPRHYQGHFELSWYSASFRPISVVGSDPGYHVPLVDISFFSIIFTVLKYTQCKIYHFDHFGVALSTFVRSCSHHHRPLQSSFYLINLKF